MEIKSNYMKVLCISTFGQFGRIKHLTLNRTYESKFHTKDKIIIIDDSGRPSAKSKLNFIEWEKMIKFESIID